MFAQESAYGYLKISLNKIVQDFKQGEVARQEQKQICLLKRKKLINLERKRSLSFALQYARDVHYTERGLDL